MPVPDFALVQEILRRFWHLPVMRALESGALRYSEVAATVGDSAGRRPGDGTITKALKELRKLGVVQRRPVAGTPHHVWTLTAVGRHAVDTLKAIDQTPRTHGTSSSAEAATASTDAEVHNGKMTHSRASDAPSTPRRRAQPIRIDTSVPHPARRYNYWLGGKDHFAADRESGDRIAEMMPTVRLSVRENRRFQTRVVRYLAGAGIRQYLDIGTGIPAPDNPHEVAQGIDPTCRVAYVDNDPIVLAHSRALLSSTPEGATCFVEADLREPYKILNSSEVRATLDFSQPLAVLLVAVLHFLDDEDAYRSVSTLVDALAPGSYLAVSHGTLDYLSPDELKEIRAEQGSGRHVQVWPRSREGVSRFFGGLELVTPGIVPVSEWHDENEPHARPTAKEVAMYGGVAMIK